MKSNKAKEYFILLHKILDSNVFKTARRIGIYLSLSSEIGTERILCAGLSQNKEVNVPFYTNLFLLN